MSTVTNAYRRRRRDSTVELSRVGGVNAPVGSHNQFTIISCAVELLGGLVTGDDIMTSLLKKLSISVKVDVVKPLQSLFGQFPNLSTESAGCRRNLVANSTHTDTTQLDNWVASASTMCVLGISGPSNVYLQGGYVSATVVVSGAGRRHNASSSHQSSRSYNKQTAKKAK